MLIGLVRHIHGVVLCPTQVADRLIIRAFLILRLVFIQKVRDSNLHVGLATVASERTVIRNGIDSVFVNYL
jgi:hypothetical protein